MKLFSVDFWSYSGERALKTFAQAAVAFIGSGTVGLFEINWYNLLSVALGAAFLSVMTSIITHGRSNKSEE